MPTLPVRVRIPMIQIQIGIYREYIQQVGKQQCAIYVFELLEVACKIVVIVENS